MREQLDALTQRREELDQFALDGNHRKALALELIQLLHLANRLEVPGMKATIEILLDGLAPQFWRRTLAKLGRAYRPACGSEVPSDFHGRPP